MLRRRSFQELTKAQQDLMMLGYLQSHQRIDKLKDHYGTQKDRIPSGSDYRKGIRYFFYDLQVCRRLFFFIRNMSLHRFANLSDTSIAVFGCVNDYSSTFTTWVRSDF